MGTPRNSADVGVDQYVGEAFRMELLSQRIKQRQVAERLHLSQPTVSSRLNGDTPLSASEVASLAAMCRKPVQEFFPSDEQLAQFRERMHDLAPVTRQSLSLHTAPVVSIWTAPSQRLSAPSFIPSQQAG